MPTLVPGKQTYTKHVIYGPISPLKEVGPGKQKGFFGRRNYTYGHAIYSEGNRFVKNSEL